MTLLIGVACLALSACIIRWLGDRARVVEDVILVVSLGCDVAVVVAIVLKRPRAAWSWTLLATGSCVVLFAMARPSLTA